MIRRTPPFTARRIALIKPSALGDVVQTLPVLAALRERFPNAKISWIVNKAYAPLLQPISLLDEVIPFDRAATTSTVMGGIQYFWSFLKNLRARRFDFVLDLQGLLRSGAFSLATGAHRRWGLQSAREGSRYAYNFLIDDLSGSQSAVDRYWRAAEALGVGHLPKQFPLEISDAERDAAISVLSGLPRPWIAIQPGARWETKRWPAGSFAAASQTAFDRFGGSAIILGGREEEPVATETAHRLRAPVRILAGRTSLRILPAILEQCDVLFTNDTGPMHLAAVVETPTVSVFTCTSPHRAGPFGDAHRIVQTTVACRESYIRTCPRMICMADLTPEKVAPSLVASLEESLKCGRRSA